MKKLKGFHRRNKACLNLSVRKAHVQATSLNVMDYGYIYMHATSSTLRCICSCSLGFISNSLSCTHHCVLYDLVFIKSMNTAAWVYEYMEAITGELPSHLYNLLSLTTSYYNSRSARRLHCWVPAIQTELGGTASFYFVPWSQNNLQNTLQINDFVSLRGFKDYKNCATEECSCFS